MKHHISYFIFGLILVVFISSCAQQDRQTGEIPVSSPSTASQGLGNLCSGEEVCKEFCQDNHVRCEDYCKENYKNKLCAMIFPYEEGNKKQLPVTVNETAENTEQTTESDLLTDRTQNCKPVGNHQYYRTDRTFVIDPTDSNIMYVNIEHKGFFKSVDGGKTWMLKTKGIKAYSQTDDPDKPCYGEYPVAVIDPNNPKHIVLGLSGTPTTFDFGWTTVGGLVESWDGGENWKQIIQGWMNIYVTDVVIDSTNSNVIYYSTAAQASSYTGADPNKIFVTKGLIYKTTDSGKTWEELSTDFFVDASVTAVYLNPKNSQEIYAITYRAPRPKPGEGRDVSDVEQMGQLKSLDGGKTWKSVESLPEGYGAVIESDVAQENYLHVVVSPYYSGSPRTFYSTDGGVTFKESNVFVDIVKYDPHDETGNHLLGYQRTTIGSDPPGIYESRDAGATWERISDAPKEILDHLDLLSQASNIVWDPKDKNVVYLTGAGGYVWKSVDGGKTWEAILNLEKLNY